MRDRDFLELFQLSVSRVWEQTVNEILEEDVHYQETIQREDEFEQKYLKLNLTEEQRSVIDEMLLCKEQSSMQYADASYLAGIKNAIQLYRALKL